MKLIDATKYISLVLTAIGNGVKLVFHVNIMKMKNAKSYQVMFNVFRFV